MYKSLHGFFLFFREIWGYLLDFKNTLLQGTRAGIDPDKETAMRQATQAYRCRISGKHAALHHAPLHVEDADSFLARGPDIHIEDARLDTQRSRSRCDFG